MVRVGVLSGYGINADKELAYAFGLAGAEAELVHLEDLFADASRLGRWQILAFPGGFSFGDHLGSGNVLAHSLRNRLGKQISEFVLRGGLVLGICNGFQTLVRMGLLPNLEGDMEPEVGLIHNQQGKFIDSWVSLELNEGNHSPWLSGFRGREIEFPIRHGEGRFIFRDPEVRKKVLEQNLVAFRYRDNPNGSEFDIAGITDRTGQVLGLMPHPEAFVSPYQHPSWSRGLPQEPTVGLELIGAAVRSLT